VRVRVPVLEKSQSHTVLLSGVTIVAVAVVVEDETVPVQKLILMFFIKVASTTASAPAFFSSSCTLSIPYLQLQFFLLT
jgi:hypothetical protein